MENKPNNSFSKLVEECETAMRIDTSSDLTDQATQIASRLACAQLASQFEAAYQLHNQSYILEDGDYATVIKVDNDLILDSPSIAIEFDDAVYGLEVDGPIKVQYIGIEPVDNPTIYNPADPEESYAGPHIIFTFDLPSNDQLPPSRYLGSAALKTATVSALHEPHQMN